MMEISALLTSAGINISICIVLLSLYSILRKQPANYCVYFGRRLVCGGARRYDPFWYERFVPSPSWLVKAWETSEDELLAAAGLDAVVFLRMVNFSIRIFFITAVVCIAFVLPVNYYGQPMVHKEIHLESSEVFTIENIKEGSKWLWVHCLALYIITSAACLLLYFEYRTIAKMRLGHITGSASKPSQFTVLIRAIPWSPEQSYSDTLSKYFTNYYSSSYMSHQMVYHNGIIQRLLRDAEKMCRSLKHISPEINCKPSLAPCTFCGGPTATNSFHILSNEGDCVKGMELGELTMTTTEQERPAAFVFFKTRYDALVASEVLQSSNPMLWVTNLAPEPHDVYWRNLNIPYRQLWIRRITTLAGAVAFMFVFLIPVTFIQGLTQLEQLSHAFPFLRGILKKEFINQAITGYIPSVILNLFFYAVPPLMMYFSTFEGCISRSITKKSACIKVLYFTIWNDFFVNSLSGSIIRQLNVFSTVRDIPAQLARAVPTQLRKSKEVTTEEYNEFYRKNFTEYLDPLASSHFTTEGEVGFRAILYVPPVSPMGKDDVVNQKTKNIRLYVKRVFISDGFDGELFPRYLSFIKGVVDSHDLPLNVSREILQESRIVWIMKKRLVKKAFNMIFGISLSENREDYEKCRANFGKYLKLVCIHDR